MTCCHPCGAGAHSRHPGRTCSQAGEFISTAASRCTQACTLRSNPCAAGTAGSWRPGHSAPWWARSSNLAAEFPPAALKQQKQTREAEMACRLDNPSCNTAHACGAGGEWGVRAVGARTPEAQANQMRSGPPQMFHQPCSRTQDALTSHTHAGDSGMCHMCSPPVVQSRRCAQLPIEHALGTPGGSQRMSHVQSKHARAPHTGCSWQRSCTASPLIQARHGW